MKRRIEKRIGILLDQEEFEKAEAMADAKLRFIISISGDEDGAQLTKEYREELIYEAALHNAFQNAAAEVAIGMLDMKKVPGQARTPSHADHILA